MEDGFHYQAADGSSRNYSPRSYCPFLIRRERLAELFGVPFTFNTTEDLIASVNGVVKDFVENERTFLIMEQEDSSFERSSDIMRPLYGTYVQVLASSLLNARDYDRSAVDQTLCCTGMVIFEHVKNCQNTGARKKLLSSCHAYALAGDAVSCVFMEAFRTTLSVAQGLAASDVAWQRLLQDDMGMKREDGVASLISQRLTDMLEHLVNRLVAYPSPIIDSRFSILGFFDSHSRRPWNDTLMSSELQKLRKTAMVARSNIGDQPLGWMSLLHYAAFADNAVFDRFHSQVAIPLALPLSVEAPSEGNLPIPSLARLAVKVRTKTKFTLPNASLLRESPLGWGAFTQAVLLLLTVRCEAEGTDLSLSETLSNLEALESSIESLLLGVTVAGELDGRRLCRLLLVLIGDKLFDGECVNPRALLLYKWMLKWFHATIIREVFCNNFVFTCVTALSRRQSLIY
eukprot:Blabericola_migrator_1__9738@NODE_532_length_7786_cov_102_495531_g405_i0_p1_GENE_NODE_532_length_7786_cov_102_495531_g405_i0NODE_532_length_7786_cov_102_495531_g405_i0_p1_ORF_typecomplete_len458_score66_86_NODE_532_length_7786_cov_102_495531_g405_i0471420